MMSLNVGPAVLKHDPDNQRELAMRKDELMKPDIFSEALLFVVGAAIFMVLVSMLWLAVFRS
jgi:hypothetical protein